MAKYVRKGIRATPKQIKTTHKLYENIQSEKPKPLASVLVESGYSVESAKHPAQILSGKGYKAIFSEIGLTPDFIIKALHEDIEKKPQRRLGELTLAADILGMKDQKEHTNTAPTLNITVEHVNEQPKQGYIEPSQDVTL